MNLIDISSWQKGIDLQSLFSLNPDLDGVIIKSTQGTGYINPEFSGWAKTVINSKKLLGVYHYLDGADANAEASHFYNSFKPYVNKAVPVADYEGIALNKGTSWLKRFLEHFKSLSGVKCMIYCSLSVIQEQDVSQLTDYPLWIAQYADMNPVNGFVKTPWQKGSVAPFTRYAMHQYTSCGHLKGYSGNLDFDKFYGTVEDWRLLTLGKSSTPSTNGVDASVVNAVLDGKYGNGPERISRLTSDGYDAQAVQDKVNELYAISLSCKKYIRGNEDYLNPIMKIVRLL